MAHTMMPSKKNWSMVRRLVGYTRFEQDALPILNSVIIAHGLSPDADEEERLQRRSERGGFERRIRLLWTE
jgi:hypothetical protein